ncbi:MAG: SEC-C metal-binding domain-containing protein [Anaerovoracaceae bacterium]
MKSCTSICFRQKRITYTPSRNGTPSFPKKKGRSHQGIQQIQDRCEGEKPDRNDPCPCGSGKKYKKCCGA